MNKIKWEQKETRDNKEDFRVSGVITDSNKNSISYSLAARPKRNTNLYIGQVSFRFGFAMRTVAQKEFGNVTDAQDFVESEFGRISSMLDGLVKSQMQDVLLDILKQAD